MVIVAAVDRLSRDTTDLMVIARDLHKAGAGLRSLAEPVVDTTSDFAELVLAMLGVFAKLERRAAIAARRAGSAKATIRAALAVYGHATLQEPQQPQQPQWGRVLGGAPTLMGRPQEPQQPHGLANSMDEADAIEERAAADRVPACYLDAGARLQCQRPLLLTEIDWRRAIDDAGRFLDAWGADAAALQWSAAANCSTCRAISGPAAWFGN